MTNNLDTSRGLMVWLPLNGDTRNQGVSGIKISGSPASWSSGKLGQAATFTGSISNVIYDADATTKVNYTDNFTWCCWICPNYTGTTLLYAFTVGRADAGSFGYGLRISNTTTAYVHFGSSGWIVSVASNEWAHIAFVKQGTQITIYKNGLPLSGHPVTFSGTLPSYSTSEARGLGIGCFHYAGDIYPYYGKLQDFRIYSYALSQLEIKELSRGKVGHWLGNDGLVIPNLYTSDTLVRGELFSGSFTKTIMGGYTNYKLNRTGNGNNSWPNMSTTACSFVADKTYVWHCKIRVNSCSAGFRADGFVLRNAVVNNDYTHGGVGVDLSEASFGKWKVYESLYTVPAIQSQGNTASQPQLQFYCGGQAGNGTVYSVDFDITDCGIYLSDVKLGAGWVANIGTTGHPAFLSDISGLGRHGLVTGGVTLDASTPRYDKSLKLSPGGQVTCNGTFPTGSNPTFTVNLWICPRADSYGAFTDVIGFTGNYTIRLEVNNTTGTGWSWWNYPLGTSGPLSGLGALTKNTWYMVTLTCNGSNFYTYLDGVLKVTTPVSGTAWQPNGNLYLGDTGNMTVSVSDVRVYTTALSADDIQELYSLGH